GVLAAAKESKAHRRGPEPERVRRAAPRDEPAHPSRRARNGIHVPRHARVSDGWRGAPLLHGDEYARPGRASRHRDGDGRGPGPRADPGGGRAPPEPAGDGPARRAFDRVDRKSTRLNSSHVKISY